MSVRDVVQAAAGALGGAEATYVEDVFSTYLYTGNGSTQTISNGIALASGNLIDTSTFDGIRITYDHNHSDPVRAIIEKSDDNSNWTTVLNSSDLQWANGEQGDKSAGWTATSAKYWRIRFTDPADGNIGGQGDSLQEVEWRQNGSYITGAYSEYTITSSGLGGTLANITDGNGSTGMDSISEGATVVFSKNGAAVEGQGGMLWFKSRNNAVDHAIYDTERNLRDYLITNSTAAQTTATSGLSSYNPDGFSFDSGGSRWNQTGYTYASWTFRKAPKFFDVVTYTGDGVAGRTVAHNLGSVPGVMIVKQTDTSRNWCVYHRSLGNASTLLLQTTDAVYTSQNHWNQTNPTDSVFTVGAEAGTNSSGGTYVAYLFAHDAGGFGDSGDQSIIKCESFTGGSPATIDLGWEPQWVLIKSATNADNWYIFDTTRGWLANYGGLKYLKTNSADAEITGSTTGLTSTGFNFNYGSGQTFVYIAIRRGPMKTPDDATKVFAPWIAPNSGTTITTNVGFPVDWVIATWRNAAASGNKYSIPRITNGYMLTNTTDAEAAVTYTFDNMTGIGEVGSIADVYPVHWAFRRAPGFFDVVCYTGTGSATTVSHNLAAVPELMIVKCRSNSNTNWTVYSEALGATEYLRFTDSATITSTARWNDTEPTSTVFTVATSNGVNGSSLTYVAYLFASVPGVSKVGSYTGNGSSQTINCGFSNGSRFVLIKRTDDVGDWHVFDTARGIVSGSDPYLELNTTNAEVTSEDAVDPDFSGFVVNEVSGSNINTSSATYIYLAIA